MKRTTWSLMIAGLLTGALGLHVLIAQPLHQQISALTREVGALQSGIRQVADFRDEVAGTNDLLSGLQAQSRRIDEARLAIENIRRLERAVRQQSDSAAAALAAMSDIARLQSDVIAQSEHIARMQSTLDQLARFQQRADGLAAAATEELAGIELAEESLHRLGEFRQRVAVESDGLEIAATQFARLIGLKKSIEQVPASRIELAQSRLADFDNLNREIIAKGQKTAQARQVSERLISLQDEIVTRGNRADIARTHAEQLLGLEETLANDAGREIPSARRNLAALLEIEAQLGSQDRQVAATVEALELMQDLQTEFLERTQDLENIRRGLTDLVLMESLVARTVRALQPLTELADLRRLDSDQLRAIARSMLGKGPQRVAAHDEMTPPLSRRASRDETEVISSPEALVPMPIE